MLQRWNEALERLLNEVRSLFDLAVLFVLGQHKVFLSSEKKGYFMAGFWAITLRYAMGSFKLDCGGGNYARDMAD